MRNQTETFSTSDPVLTSYLLHSWHNSWLILQISKQHKLLHKHLTCEYVTDDFSFIIAICKNVITLRKMASASLNNYWMFISLQSKRSIALFIIRVTLTHHWYKNPWLLYNIWDNESCIPIYISSVTRRICTVTYLSCLSPTTLAHLMSFTDFVSSVVHMPTD